MRRSPRLFLDTSVVFAAVLSDSGGSRLLFKLGEAGACQLLAGPRVLAEADAVVQRKAPTYRPTLALLLDRASIEVGSAPALDDTAFAFSLVDYEPDAHVLSEAIAAQADFFVTLDRKHFIDRPGLDALPFPVGTPGDCLGWLRARLP